MDAYPRMEEDWSQRRYMGDTLLPKLADFLEHVGDREGSDTSDKCDRRMRNIQTVLTLLTTVIKGNLNVR